MFIRLTPGEDFSSTVKLFPNRKYNQLLPIGITKEMLFDLLPALTSDQWAVYCALLWYENVKNEITTPTLTEIYDKHCKNKMDKETFDQVISELTDLIVEVRGIKHFLVRLNVKEANQGENRI
jgi:hypothetical protein